VILAKKMVPSVLNMKEAQAKTTIEDAGLKARVVYANPDWPRTENEVVSKQDPSKDTKLDGDQTVTITLEDKDFAAAKATAAAQITTGNQKMGNASGMGIDTADLSPVIQSAQTKYDSARSPNQLVSDPDCATNLANSVIAECDARIAAYQAQKEREKQIAAAKAAVEKYISTWKEGSGWETSIESFWMNSDLTKAAAGVGGSTPAFTPQIPAEIRVERRGEEWVVVQRIDRDELRAPPTSIPESDLPW